MNGEIGLPPSGTLPSRNQPSEYRRTTVKDDDTSNRYINVKSSLIRDGMGVSGANTNGQHARIDARSVGTEKGGKIGSEYNVDLVPSEVKTNVKSDFLITEPIPIETSSKMQMAVGLQLSNALVPSVSKSFIQQQSQKEVAPQLEENITREYSAAGMNYGYVPQHILKLRGLRELNLTRNRLETLPVLLRYQFSSILVLDLSYNKLKEIPQVLLRAMNELTTLNISNNKFSEFPYSEGQLPQLTSLDIRANLLATFPRFIKDTQLEIIYTEWVYAAISSSVDVTSSAAMMKPTTDLSPENFIFRLSELKPFLDNLQQSNFDYANFYQYICNLRPVRPEYGNMSRTVASEIFDTEPSQKRRIEVDEDLFIDEFFRSCVSCCKLRLCSVPISLCTRFNSLFTYKDILGYSLLKVAILNRDVNTVDFLLKQPKDVITQMIDLFEDDSPLHFAARVE